jgi:predicted CoA-substrate-specific enzyme activase
MNIDDVIEKEFVDDLRRTRVIGLDIGSRAAKCALLYDGEIYSTIVPSGVSSQGTAKEVIQFVLEESGKSLQDIHYLVGTGYGRIAIDFPETPTQVVTEISCHAMGAHYLNKDTRTIVDIGGQDSKAIKVDPYSGKVIEFIMNDKCAAGTGRFLEKVAQMLELDLDELGDYTMRTEHPVSISSQCVVFAESEVISLKAKGESKENIAAGIHYATARRVKGLIKRIGIEDTVLFTGGVSNNKGMKKALEETLEVALGTTRMDLTLAGALGAAVYAKKFSMENQ